MSDSGRFEAFVRSHQHMVYATALRLLAHPAEAEDVAQSVFLKAFERFGELSTSDHAAGWLRTVTRHECLNYLARYRARWRFFSELETAGDATPGEEMLAAPAQVDLLERAEQHERLAQAIRALPDHQRVPLVLFHFEDLSYQEIAAELQASVPKIKTDIHRARLALKRYLSPAGV
jgi:RNA polymerase sigma-70 factor (ECF subfamily)